MAPLVINSSSESVSAMPILITQHRSMIKADTVTKRYIRRASVELIICCSHYIGESIASTGRLGRVVGGRRHSSRDRRQQVTNLENSLRLTRILVTWEKINIFGLRLQLVAAGGDFLLNSHLCKVQTTPKSPKIIRPTSSHTRQVAYGSILALGYDIGKPIHVLYKSLLSTRR